MLLAFVGQPVTEVDVERWHAEMDQLHGRIGVRFRRSEPRRRARQYLCGLASGLDRKNGWTLAERAGDVSPDGMQRLLRWADWDVDAVRDDVRDYVVEHLGDPAGVLIVDDTGFLKKGTRSDIWFRGRARRDMDQPLGATELWLARFQAESGWHRYVVRIEERHLPSPNPGIAADRVPEGWRLPKDRAIKPAGD